MDYAVFKTGGKQYRVKPGDTLDVEKLTVAVDSIAEFGEVLAISNNGEVTFGSPMIEGARVLARVDSHYKDKKLMVFVAGAGQVRQPGASILLDTRQALA